MKNRINELRLEQKLTWDELADALNISRSAIWRFGKGEREIKQSDLEKIATFFNVSIDYLLGLSNFRELNEEKYCIEFKNRLKILRKERGLTQSDLANYLNTSKANVSRWELGDHEMSYSTLNELASFFDTTIDYLLGVSDIRNIENQLLDKQKFDSYFFSLYEEISDLNDEQKEEILKVIKIIKNFKK